MLIAVIMSAFTACGDDEAAYTDMDALISAFTEAYDEGSEDDMVPLFSDYISGDYSEDFFKQAVDGNLDIISAYAEDKCGGGLDVKYDIVESAELSKAELMMIDESFKTKGITAEITEAENVTILVSRTGRDGECSTAIHLTVINENGAYKIYSQDFMTLKTEY